MAEDAPVGSASDLRMRRMAMATAVAAIAPVSILGVALTASSWWEGLTISIGYLLTLGVLREWSLERYPRRAVFALMFTAVAWGVGALTAASPISFVPLSLVGGLLVARTGHRILWIVALTAGVTAIGASAFAAHPVTGALAATYLLIPFLGTLSIAGVLLASEQAWHVVRRLESATEMERELAVAGERMRFVGDLHDIHGQTLHVIRLRTVLARRLVRADPDRAESELDEIRRLAEAAIADTRSLAHATYALNLVAEIENAKRLCEAAGITVETRIEDGAGTSAHPLLAQVLREATTNLLRHALTTTVTITASPGAVEIVNDGVHENGESVLNGLARLRRRVEDTGGELRIARAAGLFTVGARVDPVSAGTAGGATR